MRKLVIGITAHVDAGKTTLSEGLLYTSGAIRKIGRVDNQDAFLDTDALEKARGITIFSKQAVFTYEDMDVTLLDTPGHVDFSAEMERTLQVLDYAILVISGADGVQGHTQTLWRLLKRYQVPVFLFVNKMDQPGTDKTALLAELKDKLSDGCISFSEGQTENFYEEIAMEEETAMEEYLETGSLNPKKIKEMIAERKVFPCFFGSALKLEGVEEFLQGLLSYTLEKKYPKDFGAKVFKIARDEQGNRLTYMKITGGSLKVKALLTNKQEKTAETGEIWEEKVNQIRVYSGNKYEAISEAFAGSVCAVTGLEHTFAGMSLGCEETTMLPLLEPVLMYRMLLPEGCDPAQMLPKLRQLEEEEPELHIVWNEKLQELQVQIMGEVQTEILQSMIKERFDTDVSFGEGNIVYKETIANTVEGVGHFEPLRHYAEVHLLLEPTERGGGMQFATDCSEDLLSKNWQRLIYTHLEEKEHIGVLTGSAITDMKITLIAGRAHQKHTEGGDFRQATYRAIRQGLMEAESVLLEPYYEFRLEIPQNMVGRAMTELDQMHGSFVGPVTEGDMAVLTGSAPVACMRNYQKEVTAYTKGCGRLFLVLKGYDVCHNTDEVIAKLDYNPDHDFANPTGSVFCAHGAGFVVSWDEVKNYMHLEGIQSESTDGQLETKAAYRASYEPEKWIDAEEVDAIINRTYHANTHEKSAVKKWKNTKRVIHAVDTISASVRKTTAMEKYLLVDGYNIIFAWEELRTLADINIDGARGKLLDILSNYQGIRKCNLIVVFDAYRVVGHQTEIFDYHNIHVVYTKEAETADAYIEKFAHENGRKYDVTVATSDGLEQIIIRGQGCRLFSATEFAEEIKNANTALQGKMQDVSPKTHNYLLDHASEEVKNALADEIKE